MYIKITWLGAAPEKYENSAQTWKLHTDIMIMNKVNTCLTFQWNRLHDS
jgi:hypothetical protein